MGVLVSNRYWNTVLYVASNGNNANAGTDPALPKADIRNGTNGALDGAAAGTLVVVGPGTFAQSNTDAKRAIIPDGCGLIGAGKGVTVLTGTHTGLNTGGIVSFLGSGLVRDLTVDGSSSGNTIGISYYAGGTDAPAANGDISIENVEVKTRTDGVFLRYGFGLTARIIDSEIKCLFDALTVGTDGVNNNAINVFVSRCFIEGEGPSSGARSSAVSVQLGSPRVTLRHCSISGRGSTTITTGNGNYGVQILATAVAPIVRVEDCSVRVEPHATLAVEYRAFDNLLAAGKLFVDGGTFDGPINGNVIVVPAIARTGFFPHS